MLVDDTFTEWSAPDPELIQPRHEEIGAFMATAHAKFTGEIGCCMATDALDQRLAGKGCTEPARP